MTDLTLKDALIAIESEAGIELPLGFNRLPLAERFSEVLALLKSNICPRKTEISKRADSEEVSLAVCLTDVLITHYTGIPAPVSTVSRHIAKIGLEKFCNTPESLLEAGVE
ncbi:hypothetical protein GCM10009092_11390 [Bowmanella denitrificans]|uniref:Uncharacterized protein n=1 Tax=Bowmanella denitrificans TaxID=366582 RepID=A0ABP3GQ13_9ALTE